MKRLFFLITLIICTFGTVKAHAAGCSGPAQCISEQAAGGSGSSVNTLAILFSPNNTATNTLFSFIYLNCATPWVTGNDVTFADSNSNSWNHIFYTQYVNGPGTGYQYVFFGWALSVNAGANTLTASIVGHTDCQATGGAWEYTGVIPYITGNNSIVKNSNVSPVSATWPLSSSVSTTGTSDLAFTIAFSDTNNTGTFTNTSGWNQTGSTFSGAATTQMAAWDQTSESVSSTVGNTGGSGYSVAFMSTLILNRTTAGPPPTNPQISTACNAFAASGTVIPCYNSVSLVAGDYLVAAVNGVQNGYFSGCTGYWFNQYDRAQPSDGWYIYAGSIGAQMNVFYSTAVQTCTPEYNNVTSIAPGGAVLQVNLYHNFAQYGIEFLPQTSNGLDTSGTISNIQTIGSEDTIVGIDFGENNYLYTSAYSEDGGTFSPTPPLTTSRTGIVFFHDNVTPGTYSFSANDTCCNMALAYMIFRKNMPTGVAALQQNFCSTAVVGAVASLVCQLPQVSTEGDSIRVYIRATLGYALTTNMAGLTCIESPGQWNSNNPTVAYDCYVGSAPPSSPISVTVTYASSTADIEMMLNEVQGLAPNNPVSGSSSNELEGTTAVYTQTVGPIYLQQAGTYYMDGIVDAYGNNSAITNPTLVPQTPFVARLVTQYQSAMDILYDTTMIESGPFSQTANVVSSLGTLKPSINIWTYGAQTYNYPVMLQDWAAYSVSGTNAAQLNEPTSGGLIVDCAASDTFGSWVISSIPAATWNLAEGCGTEDEYCDAWALSPGAGAVSVTTTKSGNIFASVEKYSNLNSLFNTSTTVIANSNVVGPVDIAAVAAPSMGIACNHALGTDVGVNTYFSGIAGTNQQVKLVGFSDAASVGIADFYVPSLGTYGITFSTEHDVSKVAGTILMFGTVPVSLPTVQPNVTVISQNADILHDFRMYAGR